DGGACTLSVLPPLGEHATLPPPDTALGRGLVCLLPRRHGRHQCLLSWDPSEPGHHSWADLESAGRHAALSVLDAHGLAPPLPPLLPRHREVPGAPLDRRRAGLVDPAARPGEWGPALPRTQDGRQLLDV